MRGTYVWRDGKFVEKRTGEVLRTRSDRICVPYVMRDIPEYTSPIDGKPITSRSHRRDDLARNGCIEVEPRKRPRGFKNKRFAEKRGLPYGLNE